MKFMGVETEYQIQAGGKVPELEDTTRRLVYYFNDERLDHCEDERKRSTNAHLYDGSRRYTDVGHHPETATALARSALELVTCDWAGREKTDKAAEAIGERMHRSVQARYPNGNLVPHRPTVYRRVRGTDTITNGRHFNHVSSEKLIMREHFPEYVAPILLAQLGTISLLGGGSLDPFDEGKFVWHQKAVSLHDYITTRCTELKPLISIRDEPHATPEKYQRVHITGVDVLHSPYGTWLQSGILSLATRLSDIRPDMALGLAKNLPEGAFKTCQLFNRGDPLTTEVCTIDGKSLTQIAMITLVIEAIETAFDDDSFELDHEDLLIMAALKEAVGWQEERNTDELGKLFDSYRRWTLFRQAWERKTKPERMKAIDLSCDKIGDETSKRLMQGPLEEAGFARLADLYGKSGQDIRDLIELRKTTPPPGRDAVRVEFIRGLDENEKVLTVTYDCWHTNKATYYITDLINPRVISRPRHTALSL